MFAKIAALMLAALFLLPSIGHGAIHVAIANESVISGQTITLGDIAEFTGDEAARIALLKQIPLGSAPQPGTKTSISRESLNARLAASQADFSGVVWAPAPESIVVVAGGQVVSGQILADKAKSFLHSRFPKDGKAEYSIALLQEIPDLVVPLGAISYDLSGGSIRFGVVQTVFLLVATDKAQFARVPVKCEIKRHEMVLKTTGNISPRQVLTSTDVRREKLDTSRLTGYLTDPAQAVGLAVNRPLQTGAVIFTAYLDKPVIIKRGTPVVIVANFGGIEATASGTAQHDGREGQLISVRNIATGRLVTGRVTGAGRVRAPH